MKKNCPWKKGLSSFSDQFYENKTDPFPKANSARAGSDCLKQRAHMLSKCLCGETLAPFHWKGDRSRRGTLLDERKCMKRWRSGRLNPYTPGNVSTYKRGLKWLTGNMYRKDRIDLSLGRISKKRRHTLWESCIVMKTKAKKCNIRHFQISHNAPYLPRKKFA